MPKRANIADPMTMEPTPSIVIPTGADDSRSEPSAEWRDLLFFKRAFHAVFLLILVVAIPEAVACTEAFVPTKIGHNFKVIVLDQKKPVEGLRIELSTYPNNKGESHSVLVVNTNANGEAEFKGIRNGLYYLGIRHPAFGQSIVISIMRHPPKASSGTLTFEWPARNPLSARSISGVLTGSTKTDRGGLFDMVHPVYRPVPGAKLTLSRAVSSEIIASEISQPDGRFDFPNIATGLYALRVETPAANPPHWTYSQDGYILVEVSSSSEFPNLDLQLDIAACGGLAGSRPKGNESVNAQTH